MTDLTRRKFIGGTAGALVGATVAGTLVKPGMVEAQQSFGYTPEPGATLRVLRWKRFVQGDEDMWLKNTERFTAQTGVKVQVDNESWEDVRPKAAVAANVGRGPDIIVGWFDDPHQFPDKLVDLTDLASYLGNKYGGWFPVAKTYGTRNGRWVALPLGCAGNAIVYRKSHMEQAGFREFPQDTAGFLELCRAMSANKTPAGFALGNAVGDGNCWCHWLLWSHGGKVVDDDGRVVLESAETKAALEYGRELYKTFINGTLSWLDSNNNKAFLAEEISLTANGISVYYAAKTGNTAFTDDIYHANMPIGPVGEPAELNLFTQAMVFKYSKYPNAAMEYLRFMWEKEQYEPWQQAAIGYVCHPLAAYDSNPIWTADPKHLAYRDATRRMRTNGHSGPLGYASAATMADYIVVNMIAEAASGQRTPEEAMKRAHKRAERYYRV